MSRIRKDIEKASKPRNDPLGKDLIKNSLLNTLFRGRLTLVPNEPRASGRQGDKPPNDTNAPANRFCRRLETVRHSKIIAIKEIVDDCRPQRNQDHTSPTSSRTQRPGSCHQRTGRAQVLQPVIPSTFEKTETFAERPHRAVDKPPDPKP